MYSHFSIYYLKGYYEGAAVIYSNGFADNPSNSVWIVVYRED